MIKTGKRIIFKRVKTETGKLIFKSFYEEEKEDNNVIIKAFKGGLTLIKSDKMDKDKICRLIRMNLSEIEFIKENVKIRIWRIFSDISIGYIIINDKCAFTFIFDDFFEYDFDSLIYFTREKLTIFSWDVKGFKLVPREI